MNARMRISLELGVGLHEREQLRARQLDDLAWRRAPVAANQRAAARTACWPRR